MDTLTQRASALRNMQQMLPEFEIIPMEDESFPGVWVYYAVFLSEADMRLFDRLSPMFSGFDVVTLCGCPSFELGAKH